MKRAPIILLCLLSFLFLLGSAPALAQQDFGDVAFANSGPSAAQADLLLGLAQLHNFEYDDAAEHFRKAQQIAPDFALAFWGEAMTQNHAVWHEEDVPAARGILNRLAPTPEARLAKAPTERENSTFAASKFSLATVQRKNATGGMNPCLPNCTASFLTMWMATHSMRLPF